MKLFVIRERIEYEGDNVWLIAADDREKAKKLALGWRKTFQGNVIIDTVLSNYTGQEGELWTNT